MTTIKDTINSFKSGLIDKPTFIDRMYHDHHAKLHEYADYLKDTNIKKIEIENGKVIMTSRNHGIKMICAPEDFRIAPIETLNFSDYEKIESDMIENLVSEGDNFFDIGANMGWYSIIVAALRRSAHAYCFEPIPKTFAYLEENIALNSISNVTLHNFGLSDKTGSFDFYYYPEGSGNASSANVTGRSDVQKVQCETRTLDAYTQDTGVKVDFIKCDVEGAELLVFQGGAHTIERDLPIVFSEILRKWSAKFGYNPNEIFTFFRERGYEAYTVKDNCLLQFGNMNEDTIETNFFFLHIQKHAQLITRFGQVI